MSYASVPFVARGPNGRWRYLSGLGDKQVEVVGTPVPTIVSNEKEPLMPAVTAVVDALTPAVTPTPDALAPVPAPVFDTAPVAPTTTTSGGGVPMWAVLGCGAALLAGGAYWAMSKPSVQTNRRRNRR